MEARETGMEFDGLLRELGWAEDAELREVLGAEWETSQNCRTSDTLPFLSPESVALMQEMQLSNADAPLRYGLGWEIFEDGEHGPRIRLRRPTERPHSANSALRVSDCPEDKTLVSGPSVQGVE